MKVQVDMSDPNEKEAKRISRFLSLVLRHKPQTIGIELDEAGWIDVETFMAALTRNGKAIERSTLASVVRTNDKQRFEFSENGLRIRARQGHSVDVELGYTATEPPEILHHGTPENVVPLIRESGLKKQARHDVHLHANANTAVEAGGRRGKPVLLNIRAKAMYDQGYEFFVTENRVWLTDHVPLEFIDFPDS